MGMLQLKCFDMLPCTSHTYMYDVRIREQTYRRQNNCKWQLKQSPIDVTGGSCAMYIDALLVMYILCLTHAMCVLKAFMQSSSYAQIHVNTFHIAI